MENIEEKLTRILLDIVEKSKNQKRIELEFRDIARAHGYKVDYIQGKLIKN